MRKIYKALLSVSVALFVAALVANGQPQLTAANNNPVAGDAFKIYTASLPLTATVELTGADQTWDFSNLMGYDSTIYHYIDATTTPIYNIAPKATLAIYYPWAGYYNFFRATANDFSYLGGTTGNTSLYSNAYKYYSYPFTYQSSFRDTFVTMSSRGYSTHTADAYGTLILPSGPISNVLRKHEHTVIEPYAGGSTVHDYYYWILPGTHWPVYACGLVNGELTFSNYQALGWTGVSGLPVADNDVQCFPNPFSSALQVTIENFNQGNISIKNTLGEVVFSEAETDMNNSFAKTINIGFLPGGIYFLEFVTGGKQITRKIVKQ